MKSKIILTFAITILLLLLTIYLAGGGHGSYLLAKVIYPFTMLTTLYSNGISILGIILAVIQIPIYALVLIRKPDLRFFLLGIHAIAAIVALNINLQGF